MATSLNLPINKPCPVTGSTNREQIKSLDQLEKKPLLQTSHAESHGKKSQQLIRGVKVSVSPGRTLVLFEAYDILFKTGGGKCKAELPDKTKEILNICNSI